MTESSYIFRYARVDEAGTVTLRDHSRLPHLRISRTDAGTCVILLVQDLDLASPTPSH